jgi:hypothetical protein
MLSSSLPDLCVMRPDRCVLVTDSGARANDVANRATIHICGSALLKEEGNVRPSTVPSKDVWKPTVPKSMPSSVTLREPASV